MRNRDIERQISDAGERAGTRVHEYADGAAGTAQGLLDRGRRLGARLSKGGRYSRKLSSAAEDFADEANYRYRRARRQVSRHPIAAVAIVAGTLTAFLLLRRVFRSDEDA